MLGVVKAESVNRFTVRLHLKILDIHSTAEMRRMVFGSITLGGKPYVTIDTELGLDVANRIRHPIFCRKRRQRNGWGETEQQDDGQKSRHHPLERRRSLHFIISSF